MMLRTILLFSLAAVTLAQAADDDAYKGYMVLQVVPTNLIQVNALAGLGENPQGMKLDFWREPSHPGSPVHINVGPADRRRLATFFRKYGMKSEIFIPDVAKAMDEEKNTGGNHAYSGYSGYDYSKYNTYSAIQTELRNLNRMYSGMTTLLNFGSSYEGRKMEAIKVSTNGGSSKPIVFIDCGIHAREWISPATCMYFLREILKKSNSNANIRRALAKYDIIVLPVFNVDGYEYTHKGRAQRMWRKTRSIHPYSRSCIGADPNRNWNYKWGGVGTSANPCQDTYHGRSAFSEVEVLNVAKYLHSIRNRLKSYYNIHAYSQMWMTPWSYTKTRPYDYNEIERVALAGISELKSRYGTPYTHGPPPALLYAVSGGSIDWTYGALNVKYSYALELRDKGRYGFLLPAYQILPTGEETTYGLIAAINAMR